MKKIIISIICIALIATAGAFIYENNKEYVGGNALHFEFITELNAKAGSVSPPWINNGFVYYLLFRPLVIANSDFTEYSPSLAKSYTVSDDGLTYTFYKRENIKWSDGEEISIHDVMFSLEAALLSPTIDPVYSDAFKNIKNIETEGITETITITLREPQTGFLQVLSQFLILPKHCLEADEHNLEASAFWDNPVGSGMYMLTEKTDAYYKLEPNPYYIGKAPKIQEIYLHKDPLAKLDVYLATNIEDMVDVRSLHRDYTEQKLPITFYRYFAYNINNNPKMHSIDLRRTINRSIHNKQILEDVFLNIGELHHVAENVHPYDFENAKLLLAETGYNTEIPLRLAYYRTDTTSQYLVQSLIKNLEDVGFTIKKVQGSSLSNLLNRNDYDILLKDLTIIDPLDWYNELHSNNPHSQLYGSDGSFDTLLEEAKIAPNTTSRKEYLAQLDKLGYEQIKRFPIINLNQALYISPRLQIPKNARFGNPWYIFDLKFEEWKIKKQ